MSKIIGLSEGHNDSYLAKIVLVTGLEPVKGLDNLVAFKVDRRQILTSKSTTEGTYAIYFPDGCRINPLYIAANNEYRADLGLNADRLNKGGFFEEKSRVKTIRFKSNVSEGYLAPISTLEPIIGKKYKELEKYVGEYFDMVDGVKLLEKYLAPAAQVAGPKAPRDRDKNLKKYESKVIERQFRFHYSTAHLDKNLHRIKPTDLISITWKLHGTSFISSKVLCKRKPSFAERVGGFFERLLGEEPSKYTEYANLYASRSVVKNEILNPDAQHYYGTDIYKVVNEAFKDNLFTGETVYGEIVGFVETGKPIQGSFDYGCKPGEHKAFVYRITYTLYDGTVIDLPYAQMVERCEELNATPVPLAFMGKASDLVSYRHTDVQKLSGVAKAETLEEWQEQFYEYIDNMYITGQNSQFCKNKVPEEGVVVRVEGIQPFALKFVDPAYKAYNSKQVDAGVVDTEEQEEINAVV